MNTEIPRAVGCFSQSEQSYCLGTNQGQDLDQNVPQCFGGMHQVKILMTWGNGRKSQLKYVNEHYSSVVTIIMRRSIFKGLVIII